MRLIHIGTLELREFFGRSIPPYAILSHTWGEDEVSFQEMQSGDGKSKAGYDKVRLCCEKANADGFEYCWVDTCCIDKTSSAELSEAINSMYKWYRVADVCYVYLADVPPNLGKEAASQAFQKSRWFTRGWTLQELIAPLSVVFFDSDWEEIGTKGGLKSQISEITKIKEEVLHDADAMREFSVAQKMSRVSKRETTRVEDIAYCLLGIFEVSMPMLYGEDDNAFIRLQEEIMKNTNDQTLFAWTDKTSYFSDGLLASKPEFFKDSGNIVQKKNLAALPFFLTNKGINLNLPMKTLEKSIVRVAVLDCQENREIKSVGIYLQRMSETADVFNRIRVNQLAKIDEALEAEISKLKPERVYIKQKRTSISSPEYLGYDITTEELEAYGFLTRYSCTVDDAQQIGIVPDSTFKAHALLITNESGDGFVLLLKCAQGSFAFGGKQRLVADVADFTEIQLDRLESGFLVLQGKQKNYAGIDNGGNSDRVIWQHPVNKWWIIVQIKRSIMSGKRTNVVHIGWHTPKAD